MRHLEAARHPMNRPQTTVEPITNTASTNKSRENKMTKFNFDLVILAILGVINLTCIVAALAS